MQVREEMAALSEETSVQSHSLEQQQQKQQKRIETVTQQLQTQLHAVEGQIKAGMKTDTRMVAFEGRLTSAEEVHYTNACTCTGRLHHPGKY